MKADKVCEVEIGDNKTILDDDVYMLYTAAKKYSKRNSNTGGDELLIAPLNDMFEVKRVKDRFALIIKSFDSTSLLLLNKHFTTLNSIPVQLKKQYPIDGYNTVKINNMQINISFINNADEPKTSTSTCTSPEIFDMQTQNINYAATQDCYDVLTQKMDSPVSLFKRDITEIDDDSTDIDEEEFKVPIVKDIKKKLNKSISVAEKNQMYNCSEEIVSILKNKGDCDLIDADVKGRHIDPFSAPTQEIQLPKNDEVCDEDADTQIFDTQLLNYVQRDMSTKKQIEDTTDLNGWSLSIADTQIFDSQLINYAPKEDISSKKPIEDKATDIKSSSLLIADTQIFDSQLINYAPKEDTSSKKTIKDKATDIKSSSLSIADTQIFDSQLINYAPKEDTSSKKTIKDKATDIKSSSLSIADTQIFDSQLINYAPKEDTSSKKPIEDISTDINSSSLSIADTQIFDADLIQFYNRPNRSKRIQQVCSQRPKPIIMNENLLKNIKEQLDLDVSDIFNTLEVQKDEVEEKNNYFNCTQELENVLMSQKCEEESAAISTSVLGKSFNDSSDAASNTNGTIPLELPGSQEIKNYLSTRKPVIIPETDSESEADSIPDSQGESEYVSIVHKQKIPPKRKTVSKVQANKRPLCNIQVSDVCVPKKKVKKDDSLCNKSTRSSPRIKISKIMLTQIIKPEKLTKAVEKLGGKIVQSKGDILVSSKISRTFKFLMAVSSKIPIVHPDWISASLENNRFLDPYDYLLQDSKGEMVHKFKLNESLKAKDLLLSGYTIYLSPNVLPPPVELKQVIVANGGVCIIATSKKTQKAIPDRPKVFTVGVKEDKDVLKLLPKPHYDPDLLVTGVIKQKLDFTVKKWCLKY